MFKTILFYLPVNITGGVQEVVGDISSSGMNDYWTCWAETVTRSWQL